MEWILIVKSLENILGKISIISINYVFLFQKVGKIPFKKSVKLCKIQSKNFKILLNRKSKI